MYLVIGVVILAVVAGVTWFQMQGQQAELGGQPQAQQEEENSGLVATAVVLYTDSGFAPQTFTVKAGETVTFVNGSTNPMWPATAVHPTHTAYPGSDKNKCGTAEEPNIFDACKPIAPGEEWSFKFDQKGSWNYHDHLSPNYRETITVE